MLFTALNSPRALKGKVAEPGGWGSPIEESVRADGIKFGSVLLLPE